MKENRLNEIEQFVIDNRSVSLDTICETYHISKSTVRRDCEILVKRGRVAKVHGGLKVVEAGPWRIALSPYEERNTHHVEEKEKIGETALPYIKDGDVVFIDSGTTCVQLARRIGEKNCTVITNSLQIAETVALYERVSLIMLPGKLHRGTMSFVGTEFFHYLSTLNIRKAFMASTGISIGSGITNAEEGEYNVKKAICERADKVYVLADHSKFDRASLYTYYPLEKVSAVITDREPDGKISDYCRKHGVSLLF